MARFLTVAHACSGRRSELLALLGRPNQVWRQRAAHPREQLSRGRGRLESDRRGARVDELRRHFEPDLAAISLQTQPI